MSMKSMPLGCLTLLEDLRRLRRRESSPRLAADSQRRLFALARRAARFEATRVHARKVLIV